MNVVDYLQQPMIMALIEEFYQFGLVSKAQYVRCQVVLAYVDLKKTHEKITDKQCVLILAQNPHYALSEDRIEKIIKIAKKDKSPLYNAL